MGPWDEFCFGIKALADVQPYSQKYRYGKHSLGVIQLTLVIQYNLHLMIRSAIKQAIYLACFAIVVWKVFYSPISGSLVATMTVVALNNNVCTILIAKFPSFRQTVRTHIQYPPL